MTEGRRREPGFRRTPGLRRAPLLDRSGWTVVALLVAGAVAAWRLDLAPGDLLPSAGGRRLAVEFFGAALRPALGYEAEFVAPGAPPFFVALGLALGRTFVFALAAMSLAVVGGAVLGVLGSSTWRARGGVLGPSVQVAARATAVAMRSVHELLYAVLFLAALGYSPATGVLAIAIPYAGILAKVVAELLDETPREVRDELLFAGATPAGAFLFGLAPRAVPDLAAYAFYRFECALRSSAILGFFGFPTLGYYVSASFANLHFREVWSYLYALVLAVLILELWSGRLRARMVA